jgi:lipopolysaccharide/colanic/teichoic acid biosynthesis glycosyltransferase
MLSVVAAQGVPSGADSGIGEWDASIRFDLYCVEDWSVMSDLMILLQTGLVALTSVFHEVPDLRRGGRRVWWS